MANNIMLSNTEKKSFLLNNFDSLILPMLYIEQDCKGVLRFGVIYFLSTSLQFYWPHLQQCLFIVALSFVV
jgi:hypothetical protein